MDLKFMLMKTDFEGPDKEDVTLTINPMVMGIGLGFQF